MKKNNIIGFIIITLSIILITIGILISATTRNSKNTKEKSTKENSTQEEIDTTSFQVEDKDNLLEILNKNYKLDSYSFILRTENEKEIIYDQVNKKTKEVYRSFSYNTESEKFQIITESNVTGGKEGDYPEMYPDPNLKQ